MREYTNIPSAGKVLNDFSCRWVLPTKCLWIFAGLAPLIVVGVWLEEVPLESLRDSGDDV